MAISLGDKVKDTVTGFEGVATTHAKHLHGCDRWWLEPGVDKDGKVMDGRWVDEPALVVTKRAVIKVPTLAPLAKTGPRNVSAPTSLPRSR